MINYIKKYLSFIIRNQNIKLVSENKKINEGLDFHIKYDIPIYQNVYRQGSESYFSMINECKSLYFNKELILTEADKELLESDIGDFVIINNKKVSLDFPYEYSHNEIIEESFIYEDSCCRIDEVKYQNKEVELNKPKRGGTKKFYVYVRDPKSGNIKKVSFGAKGMTTGINNPERRKSFVARHRCKTHANDKTKAAYWSCRLPRYIGNSNHKWW